MAKAGSIARSYVMTARAVDDLAVSSHCATRQCTFPFPFFSVSSYVVRVPYQHFAPLAPHTLLSTFPPFGRVRLHSQLM